MRQTAPVVAGVELGGTKCIAVIARGRHILKRAQWETGNDPAITLGAIAEWLADAARQEPFSALGIASFGPICLDPGSTDYGRIINTPKPGWSNADVLMGIGGRVEVPIALNTDVAGAALAEGRWGASIGCAVHVYLTIGTGIGGGIVIGGKTLNATFHPEVGHIRVRRAIGDNFAGNCPIHGDCLEGLASGPAIAARTGHSAKVLLPTDPVWRLVAEEVAELMANVILTLAPQRIVLGGGVALGQPTLFPAIHRATERILGGYLPMHGLTALEAIIVPPELGADSGVYGAVAVAMTAQVDPASDIPASPRYRPVE